MLEDTYRNRCAGIPKTITNAPSVFIIGGHDVANPCLRRYLANHGAENIRLRNVSLELDPGTISLGLGGRQAFGFKGRDVRHARSVSP